MDLAPPCTMRRVTAPLGQLPLLGKVMLAHGVIEALFPSPLTASPLVRVGDRQFRSKKKRGWAWLFLFLSLLKVRSAFAWPSTAATLGGWAYGFQAAALMAEGFFHQSIPRPTKVLGSTVCFCIAMCTWLQVAAWQQTRAESESSDRQDVVPSAPPLDKAA